ncbi:MAG: endonuclease/exonuclease/phosphatase family protein [Alphaproteobacteria bacterium]|nr:MAG: endonuclease/exonuclease/phosphatase family protein [Alphaproteobacteria bacterium]
MLRRLSIVACLWLALLPRHGLAAETPAAEGVTLRIATFNAMLNRPIAGALIGDLADPGNAQLAAVAEIIQRVRPHILLLNEFDYDEGHRAIDLFREKWLAVPHNGAKPIHYPYVYLAPVNTGVPTGYDLDHDGRNDGAADAQGYGTFPGQYGMVLLSQLPIDTAAVRTFRLFLWKDMPGALLPDDPATEAPADWYGPEVLAILRLSSKSHWDIPIRIGDDVIHILASHPTPPAFDGREDRNGRRNHDEIRFWADYVDPARSGYIRDDAGHTGGLAAGARFVILGDLNADPADGSNVEGTIQQLLGHPLIDASVVPKGAGGYEQARLQDGVNRRHKTPPETDTADFKDKGRFAVGNLRLDYVLPSKAGWTPLSGGVFWPATKDPLFRLVGTYPYVSSDHRLVWMDLKLSKD